MSLNEENPSATSTRAELREGALTAGMNPNFWYPVARASKLRRGQVMQALFQGQAFALFRVAGGAVHAVEDRCAHRQLALSQHGHVQDGHLVCGYHGWAYAGSGACVGVRSHVRAEGLRDTTCAAQITGFPVREKYGLIWLFPGDRSRAETTPLPTVPRLDARRPLAHTILVEDFDAHHSLVIENFLDLYHEYLHRAYSPFESSKLSGWERDGDTFRVTYDTRFAEGLGLKHLLPDFKPETRVTLSWRYPYLELDFEGRHALWLFFQPQGVRRTVVYGFFLTAFRVPLLGIRMPRLPSKLATRLFTLLYSRGFTEQDRVVLKGEQEAIERHGYAADIEPNPVIDPLREFTAEMWARRDSS